MSERESLMDLIRNEYDPRVSLNAGLPPDDFDDGAGRIADAIIADKILLMRKHEEEISALRSALKPFAEIARRFGWSILPEDAFELDEHLIEAPAEDVAPGAAYCLMICHFRDAALSLKEPAK